MSESVRVRRCPDGPILVRGADVVLDDEGAEHPVTRPVVAICTCGRSSLKPWCDGTHQVMAGLPGDGAGDG